MISSNSLVSTVFYFPVLGTDGTKTSRRVIASRMEASSTSNAMPTAWSNWVVGLPGLLVLLTMFRVSARKGVPFYGLQAGETLHHF